MAGVAYRAPVLPVNRYGHPIVTSFALNLQRGKPICNRASASSRVSFWVRPLLYDAPRRRNHDAERRATKFANPSF